MQGGSVGPTGAHGHEHHARHRRDGTTGNQLRLQAGPVAGHEKPEAQEQQAAEYQDPDEDVEGGVAHRQNHSCGIVRHTASREATTASHASMRGSS